MLAMNTILQSEFLKEFEEAASLARQIQQDEKHGAFTKVGANQSAGEFDTDLDEFATCAGAFKMFKELVMKWLDDVYSNDMQADRLMSHMYRLFFFFFLFFFLF